MVLMGTPVISVPAWESHVISPRHLLAGVRARPSNRILGNTHRRYDSIRLDVRFKTLIVREKSFVRQRTMTSLFLERPLRAWYIHHVSTGTDGCQKLESQKESAPSATSLWL